MFDGVGNLILRFRDLATQKHARPLDANETSEWAALRSELAKAFRGAAAHGGRRSPRVNVTLGVTLAMGTDHVAGEATSLNVHGVGVNLAQPPAVGSQVSVILECPDLEGARLCFAGRIVSVRGNLTGIEFEHLTDADRELITVVMLEEYLS